MVNATTAATAPGAPTSLTATAGNQQVRLSWSAPGSNGGAAISGYKVEYKTSAATTWTTVTRTGTTPSHTFSSLTNGTAYNFRVSATNSAGTGTPTSPVNATPATTPGVPTSLGATAGSTQVTLSWSAPSSTGGAAITNHVIERRTGTTGAWSTVTHSAAITGTNYTVTGLTNGTTYNFRVSATNSAGTGAMSNVVSATPAAATAPGAPTGLGATPGNTQVTLSWSAPSSNGGAAISNHVVERRTGSTGTWSTVTHSAAITGTNYTVTGLTNDTTYNFRVSATNSVSTGAMSNVVSATPGRLILPAVTDQTYTVDTAITALTLPVASGGTGTVTYTLVGAVPPGLTFEPTTRVLSGTPTKVGVYSVTYTASTATTLGFGWQFNITIKAAAPGAPTSLTATPGNGQVALSWSAPGSNGGAAISNHVVERRTGSTGTWTTVTHSAAITGTNYTVTGLTNGTAYNFRVKATNESGAGAMSNVANATPAATAPGAPTGLGATAGNQQVRLSWTAPSSNGGAAISNHVVERRTGSTGTWSTVTHSTAITGTNYTVTGLTNGTAYNFRVKATNESGTGAMSNVVSATPAAATAPGAPTSLGATASNGQVTLSWSAPGSNGGAAITGYKVEWKTQHRESTWDDRNALRHHA